MWIDLADVAPVKQSVLISRQMSVVVLLVVLVSCNAGRCADGCERMSDATVPSRCTVHYNPLQSDALQ